MLQSCLSQYVRINRQNRENRCIWGIFNEKKEQLGEKSRPDLVLSSSETADSMSGGGFKMSETAVEMGSQREAEKEYSCGDEMIFYLKTIRK